MAISRHRDIVNAQGKGSVDIATGVELMAVSKPWGVSECPWVGQSQLHPQSFIEQMGHISLCGTRWGWVQQSSTPECTQHFWSHPDRGLQEGKCTVSSPSWLFGFRMHSPSFEVLGEKWVETLPAGVSKSEVVFPVQEFPNRVLPPVFLVPLLPCVNLRGDLNDVTGWMMHGCKTCWSEHISGLWGAIYLVDLSLGRN